MKILVYGSIAYDQIMDFQDSFENHILPSDIKKLNISFLVNEFRRSPGGTGGNIAYNLGLLAEQPELYGAVGHDFSEYEHHLKKYKINLKGVKKYSQISTASAYIITDKKNNQISAFYPGAMKFSTPKPKANKNDLAIIAPSKTEEMISFSDYYYSNKTFHIFDPGQQIITFKKNQLRKAIGQANLVVLNDYENLLAKKITGWDSQQLLKNANILITTLGEKGSTIDLYLANCNERFKINAVKSSAVKDPTGAGDAYRAGLLKGLKMYWQSDMSKLPWLEIGQIASLSGVYAAEKYGTQSHSYSYNEFKKRYKIEYKSLL